MTRPSALVPYTITAKIVPIIIIIKLFKGIHKRHMPVQGDIQFKQVQNKATQTYTQNTQYNLNNTHYINKSFFNLDLKLLTRLKAKMSSGIKMLLIQKKSIDGGRAQF